LTSTAESRDARDGAPTLPGLVVDPDWLRDHMGHPRVRAVDLRDSEAWAEGHVPGAVQLDLARLGSSRDGCDNVLLAPDAFEELMAELGISNGDAVVAYDDQWGLAASRLVWALHRYGHGSVAVLNGGWDRWQDERSPTTTDRSSAPRGRFVARPSASVSADLKRLKDPATRGNAVLLDTRTRAEYDAGHLPGAKAWDWFTAVPADSWDCARPREDLLAEWAELGLNPAAEVVVYCRSGMRAAHTYLTLKHAGFAKVRLYDGSWQEWSSKMEEGNGH
jgi:thiosulfate/3-mercaptopyruvate sulfurtransferase